MGRHKAEIVTFKVDAALMEQLRGIENRSEFIRGAVMNALDGTCPLCNGTGTLTSSQRTHWSAFSTDHRIEICGQCHEPQIVCVHREKENRCARETSGKGKGRK